MTRNMCLKNVLMILFREENKPWRPMQKEGLGWREREKQRSDSWKKEPEESHGYAFYTPVSRQAVLCDWVWRAGGRPHRFPHNNLSSVYRIFTKLGHMIPLWKGKNPIYFGVVRSKVTVTINRIFDNRVVSAR